MLDAKTEALREVEEYVLAQAEPTTETDLKLEVRDSVVAATAAMVAARDHLLSLQREDGHWCGELEGDTILESEYLMLLWFLGRRVDARFERGCRYIRSKQLEEGGWAIYPGGPADPSASVKAYFVLKLFGDDPEAEHMRRARQRILDLGGVSACNSFTKLYLSMFGQWRWDDAPAVPPELILLPRWFYINIYEMSSWSRAIVIPLSMIWAARPVCDVPIDIDELIPHRRFLKRGETLGERSWFAFFRGVDRAIKAGDRIGLFKPFRQKSLDLCEEWITERFEQSAGLAAIFPSIVNAVIALRLRGYGEDDLRLESQIQELEKLEIVEGPAGRETLRLQPCCSPVWDTSLSLNALLESGVETSQDELQRAIAWLLDREVKRPGDWQVKNPGVEPGGWYFEYANEFYPDCDDTAEVLAVLGRARCVDPDLEERRLGAIRRALAWQLSMQNRDGGWGAFDKNCDRELLTYIPFADHNAMIDPSSVDVTARTVEAMTLHLGAEHESVRRAVSYLEREQESDGSWYGRWGSNYIYGTWLAMSALAAVGRADSVTCRRGSAWLLSVQNEDGGWGETLHSYVDPSCKGQGESTAAQTAWAILGLLAAHSSELAEGRAVSVKAALDRAVSHLAETQQSDGGWRDEAWTGTGFPEVFYLRYHYYDRFFPLQALATFHRVLGEETPV